MKMFKFSFNGRNITAIGMTHKITVTYEATDVKDCFYMLYRDYEHITDLKLNGKKFSF